MYQKQIARACRVVSSTVGGRWQNTTPKNTSFAVNPGFAWQLSIFEWNKVSRRSRKMEFNLEYKVPTYVSYLHIKLVLFFQILFCWWEISTRESLEHDRMKPLFVMATHFPPSRTTILQWQSAKNDIVNTT